MWHPHHVDSNTPPSTLLRYALCWLTLAGICALLVALAAARPAEGAGDHGSAPAGSAVPAAAQGVPPIVVKPTWPLDPPVSNTMLPGTEFEVLIVAEAAREVAGAEVTLLYDPALLTLKGEPELGSSLQQDCTTVHNPVAGELRLVLACTAGGHAGAPLTLWLVRFVAAQVTQPVTTELRVKDEEPEDLLVTDVEKELPAVGGSDIVNIILGKCGDQNGDDLVNVIDAITDLRIIVKLQNPTPPQLFLSDVNRDGTIAVDDVVMTLQHIVRLIEITTCGTAEGPLPGEELPEGVEEALGAANPPPILQECRSITPDFVVTGSESGLGGEHCFPSNQDGTFQPRTDIPGLRIVDGMDVADMDGDGDNDFLACDGRTGEVYLYTQGPAGTFVPTVVATSVTSRTHGSFFCTYLREGDFNGDGLKDFVVGDNRVANGVFVYLQASPPTAPATFNKVTGLDLSWASPTGAKCNCLFALAVGDVDEDGNPDVLLLGYRGAGAGQVRLYEGNGFTANIGSSLLFNVRADFPIVGNPTGLALFDLDQDGHLDIVVGGSLDGTHYIYKGDGTGNFAKPARPAFDINNYSGIDAYDIDQDGRDDLMVVNWSSRRLLFFRNLGGALAAPVDVTAADPNGPLDGSSIGVGAPQLKVEPPAVLDHFKCYRTEQEPANASVFLRDQFGTEQVRVLEPVQFCNPVEKVHFASSGEQTTPIRNRDHHLKFYRMQPTGPDQDSRERTVLASNQFGKDQRLTVLEPLFLAVPTHKVLQDHSPPKGLDHFKCYEAQGPSVDAVVGLRDQFQSAPQVPVLQPLMLCNPVTKIHEDQVTPALHPEAHLVCYRIRGTPLDGPVTFPARNQFGGETLTVQQPELLCAPSEKEVLEPKPLDHFKCYGLAQGDPIDASVALRDQFGSGDALVLEPEEFCNPVSKIIGEIALPILNPDAHLKFYRIETEQRGSTRVVRVGNQFGEDQRLTVFEAMFLAVPTQKIEPQFHPPPEGLDHFQCYKAEGDPVEQVVGLRDQFFESQVLVLDPLLLCNPVEKTHAGSVTPVLAPEEHLVCYGFEGADFTGTVQVENQFGGEVLSLQQGNLLCVPSSKDEGPPCQDVVEITEVGGVPVNLIDPVTGYARKLDGAFPPPPPPPPGPFDRPFGRWVSVRGNLPDNNCINVSDHEYRVEYQEDGGPWVPVITHPAWQAQQSIAFNFCPGFTPWASYQSDGDGWIPLEDYWRAKACHTTQMLNNWNSAGNDGNFRLRLTLRQTGDPTTEIMSAEVLIVVDNTAPNPVNLTLYDADGSNPLSDQCQVSGGRGDTIVTIKGQVRDNGQGTEADGDEHFRVYELRWTGGLNNGWNTIDLHPSETAITPGYRFYDGGRPDLDGTGTLPAGDTDVPLGIFNLTQEHIDVTGQPPIECGVTIWMRVRDRAIIGSFVDPPTNNHVDLAQFGWIADYNQSFCFEPAAP